MLTGRPHQPMNFENANPGPPNDVPSLGAVLGRVDRARGGLPPSVTLPHRIFNTDGSVWPGQDAGFLGRTSDPWLLNSRLTPEGYRIQEIDLPAELDAGRLSRRQSLLDDFQRRLETSITSRRQGRSTSRRAGRSICWAPRRPGEHFALRKSPKATATSMERLRSARVCCSPAAWWRRSPAGTGQLVPRSRRASGQSLLGQPHQGILAAQGGARPADRPGLRCAARGSGPSRASRRDTGRLHGRVRPHAPPGRLTAGGTTGARSSRSCSPAEVSEAARSTVLPTASAPTPSRDGCGPRTCRRPSSTAWAMPPQPSTAIRSVGPTR